jgi:hypothetical protein
MSKNNTIPALYDKHAAPEHHRVKPQEFHHSLQALPGHRYCRRCGAIGFQKHWYIDAVQEQAFRKDKSKAALCPGCTRVEQQLYEGEVVLTNSRCKTVMGEIIAMIKHCEGRCWHKNPIAKLASVTEQEQVFHVLTTSKFLAERIGKELQKAFKGNLEIKRSDRFVRVYWSDRKTNNKSSKVFAKNLVPMEQESAAL